MLQSSFLIDAFWEKKKREREAAWTFFPRTGHTLLAVLHWIFLAVWCNYMLN
jgi:hypothetical protein